MNALESLRFFYPELILIAGGFLSLFSDFLSKSKKIAAFLVFPVLLAAAVCTPAPPAAYPLFNGFFVLDPFTYFFRLILLFILSAVTILSMNDEVSKSIRSEYYSLLLFLGFGLILMASSRNLLMIYLALEFVSLLSYLLTGFLKNDARSKEASLKYFLFGSLASGIMLYGMSLIFGISGSLDLDVIRAALVESGFGPVAVTALLFMLAGFGFKISMAPFHLWTPDVYEGAPTPVTALLSVAPKALGFAVIIRVFDGVFSPWSGEWSFIFYVLSAATMTVGNLTAIAQTRMKRLLAYSSIAQAGYILMGIAAFSKTGIQGVLFYLAVYALANLGAFAVVIAVGARTGNDELASYAGLSKKSPLLAASMAVFLLSLAGMPPFAGFIAKFYVFAGAMEAGLTGLLILAVLNSAAAAYYYFRVIRMMYLSKAPDEYPLPHAPSLGVLLWVLLAGTLFLGIFPLPLFPVLSKMFGG